MWLNASRELLEFVAALDRASQLEVAVGDVVDHRPQLADRPQDRPLRDRVKGHHRRRRRQQPGQDRRDPVDQNRLGPLPGRASDHDRADDLVLGEGRRRTLRRVTGQAEIPAADDPHIAMHRRSGLRIGPGHLLAVGPARRVSILRRTRFPDSSGRGISACPAGSSVTIVWIRVLNQPHVPQHRQALGIVRPRPENGVRKSWPRPPGRHPARSSP